jgi:DNA-binding transcriptional LysR family regulator
LATWCLRDRLSLTEAGSLALTHAREVVRHLTLMRTEVVALAGEITGTLSLASLPSVTATLVAPQLRVFAERHPAVTIRLLEGSEEEVRDWLDQGAAEAGVVSLPVKGLDTAVLGDQDMVAVVPADNGLPDGTRSGMRSWPRNRSSARQGAARRCSCRSRGGLASSSCRSK